MTKVSKNLITSVDPGQITDSMMFRNRIINGDMRIDQRNAGAAVTITSTSSLATYTLDRWGASCTVASKFSVQQNAGAVASPTGFSNYLGATSLAATSLGASDYYSVQQVIEGFNFADMGWGSANAQTITVSFWVRSSLTGVFGGVVSNDVFTRSCPFSYTIIAANTWERKTITIAGDTSGTWTGATNAACVYLRFSLGSGSSVSGSAGSWSSTSYVSVPGATSVVGTSGATFYITGVQLEKGTTATPFEFRPYGTELALCQRYYQLAPYARTASYGSTSMNFVSYVTWPTMRIAPVLKNVTYNSVNATAAALGNLTISGGTFGGQCISAGPYDIAVIGGGLDSEL